VDGGKRGWIWCASHNLKALTQRADAKIVPIKEKADSSSINQAYNKHTAKSDKWQQHKSLSFMCEFKGKNKNMVDQWDILLCGLTAIQYTTSHPEIWMNSFISVNLHLKH
jgi:hypothetical protein